MIDFDNLDGATETLSRILGERLNALAEHRGRSRGSSWNDYEVALNDAGWALDSFDWDRLLRGKGINVQAYHGTRVEAPALLFSQGLLRLDSRRLQDEVIAYVQEHVGQVLPDIDIEACRVGSVDSDAARGPHFFLSRRTEQDVVGGLGRFLIEGSETARVLLEHILSCLAETPCTAAFAAIYKSFIQRGVGTLVTCSLPYDCLDDEASRMARLYILTALLYEPMGGRKWDGVGVLCLNRDVPGEWVARVEKVRVMAGQLLFEEVARA